MDDLRLYVLFNSILVVSDDERVVIKGCVQWNPVYDLKDLNLRPS